MAISCGLPVCLSGINISKQVVSVKRPDSYCVQSRETSRTVEKIFRKDCSSTCIKLSGSSSSPSIFKNAVSPIIKDVPVTAAKVQSAEKRPVSTMMRKRRESVIKEMAELDERREILKQQRVNQECRAAYLQAHDLYALQQPQSDPDIAQALLNRLQCCLEDLSDSLYHSVPAAAA